MALSSVDSVVYRLNNWLMLIESFNYFHTSPFYMKSMLPIYAHT